MVRFPLKLNRDGDSLHNPPTLGGVLDGLKTLFFSPLQRNAGRGRAGGGRGLSRARFPEVPAPTEAPGGPGPKASSPKGLEAPAPRPWRPRSWRPQALGPKPGGPYSVSACCTIDFLSPGHPKLGAGRPACWL